MKYSEKMQLLLKGVKMDEIKALEEQEAAEAAEALEVQQKEEAAKLEQQSLEEKSALESATEMIKDLENKLAAKEDELTKLNKDFAILNNKQTVKEEPEVKTTAADVMKQLFNSKKEE